LPAVSWTAARSANPPHIRKFLPILRLCTEISGEDIAGTVTT
jgi:hypothetical protein